MHCPAGTRRVRGLTLIELVVALVIIGVAMAGLAGTFALLTGVAGTEDAEEYAREARGCGEALLAVHQGPGLQLHTQCGESDSPATWAEGDAGEALGEICGGASLQVRCTVDPDAEGGPVSEVRIGPARVGMTALYLQFPREDEE